MNYWIDLFTGTTWREFREAGESTSGFSQRRAHTIDQVQPGDVLLCYMTGVMRWVGALTVLGPTDNASNIWHERDFPVCLKVEPSLLLNPDEGVPMEQLEGKVSFYRDAADRGGFRGVVRGPRPCSRILTMGRRFWECSVSKGLIRFRGLSIPRNWQGICIRS